MKREVKKKNREDRTRSEYMVVVTASICTCSMGVELHGELAGGFGLTTTRGSRSLTHSAVSAVAVANRWIRYHMSVATTASIVLQTIPIIKKYAVMQGRERESARKEEWSIMMIMYSARNGGILTRRSGANVSGFVLGERFVLPHNVIPLLWLDVESGGLEE